MIDERLPEFLAMATKAFDSGVSDWVTLKTPKSRKGSIFLKIFFASALSQPEGCWKVGTVAGIRDPLPLSTTGQNTEKEPL